MTYDVVRLGFGSQEVPYQVGWDEQRRVHNEVAIGERNDTVLLLEHEAVYTAGKRTNSWERPTDGTPVIDVDRGGKITWHGPGQLVGYPLLRLPDPMDVVAYVRRVEELLMQVCAEVGLETTRVEGRSGVWVPADARRPDRKVAAIGVRVSRGVTMHGFALNCDPDLAAYDRIVPCGITDAGVTSLTAELGPGHSVQDLLPRVESALPTLFPRTTRSPNLAEETPHSSIYESDAVDVEGARESWPVAP